MDRNYEEYNERWDLHEGRGRGMRAGQRQRAGRGRGRGRGEVERMRGTRERSMDSRPSEYHLGAGKGGRDDQSMSARGQGHRGGRGRDRGEVEEMVATREDSTIRKTEANLSEMCNKISLVMKERLESVVGNTKEEMQTNMRAGMRVLVEAVEEEMGRYLGRVKEVEDTMSRISESVKQESGRRRDMEMRTEKRLTEVEDTVQDLRAEVGMESNERRDMEKMTKERLTEVEDKVQKVWAEVGKESSERRDMEKRSQVRLAELEDKVQDVRTEVGKECSGRRDTEKITKEGLAEVENNIQELRSEVEKLKELRHKIRIKESVKEMEDKVRMAMCGVKVGNINIGLETDSKATIVREVLGKVRKRTKVEETGCVNRILKTTRVVVLGMRTERRQNRGRTEYTVPILFECQDRKDSQELERILRDAGYFPTFHWPRETMEFIWKVREDVKKMGNNAQNSYVRIMPEVREGSILIRADVKPKEGGRYMLKGLWVCPPLNLKLWEGMERLYTPLVVGRG